MQNNQINLIDKMFEYNLWANTQLIELCSYLVDEQLETEFEGVFGRIHPTLVHIIRAEGGYLNRLVGSRPWADDLEWDAHGRLEMGGVDRMVRRASLGLECGEQLLVHVADGLAEHAPALGHRQQRAALEGVGAELGDVVLGELRRARGGNVQNRRVVHLADRNVQVDGL